MIERNNANQFMVELRNNIDSKYYDRLNGIIGHIFNKLPGKYSRYFTYEAGAINSPYQVIITWWFMNDNDIDWIECGITTDKITITTIPNNQPAIECNFEIYDKLTSPESDNSFTLVAETVLTIVGTRKLVRVCNNKPLPDYTTTDKSNESMKSIMDVVRDGLQKFKITERITWNEYFMEMCDLAAKRSTCLRRKVGAVIVKNNQILSTGYNGAPSGVTHCGDREYGCIRKHKNIPSGKQQEICMASHAEMNAIAQAAKNGTSIDGATLYCNTRPCSICSRIIINSGIKKVYYRDYYPDEFSDQLFKEAGVEIEKI